MRRLSDLLLAVAATIAPTVAQEPQPQGLRPGHWVEVKGYPGAGDAFHAEALELLQPGEEEVLIGTVSEVAPDGSWLALLGQRVDLSERTRWRALDPSTVSGARVKLEGYYRGLRKFSSRAIGPRGTGRDRIAGRVDALRHTADGGFELDVMRFRVVVPAGVELEHERPLAEYDVVSPRAPSRLEALALLAEGAATDAVRERDEDDDIPGSIRLGEDLTLGLRLEWRRTDERELDLNEGDDEDRVDEQYSVRGELVYRPTDEFYALLGFRHAWLFRDDDEDGDSRRDDGRINEVYGYWRNVQGSALDVQLGRQDFDDEREWLYDENLDALRLIYRDHGARFELAAATILADGNEYDEETWRYIASVTNDDDDRTVGAYVIDQRTDLDVDEYPFHYGVRAFGEWLPDNDVWLELAGVRGYEGDIDLKGWAYDLGTTWSPDVLDPWYFTTGFACGSGDDDAGDGTDHAFRQTGIQDNNAKFGGVTSFRYYGELMEPELSNLRIFTLGVGRRFWKRHSVDLVYHRYRQDEAADFLRDTQLDRRPNGVDPDLGEELDLVLGSRPRDDVHVELVLGTFHPGDAFDDADDAFLAKIQVRFRF